MVFGFCSFPLTLHTQFSFLKICFKNLVIIVVQVCWDFLFHPSCSFFFHLLSFNSIIYLKQMCPMWLLSCTQISKWLASAWKLFYSYKYSFFTRFSFKYLPFFPLYDILIQSLNLIIVAIYHIAIPAVAALMFMIAVGTALFYTYSRTTFQNCFMYQSTTWVNLSFSWCVITYKLLFKLFFPLVTTFQFPG